jgi:hypothetical protein
MLDGRGSISGSARFSPRLIISRPALGPS